jgi:hypothetical protein
MTTEHPSQPQPAPRAPRKNRASKGSLRTAAWAAAGVALAAPWVALKAEPRPVPPDASGKARQVIIVHRTIRRVVIDPAPVAAAGPVSGSVSAPSIHYVYVGGGTVTQSSGGSSGGTTRCSGC